KMEAVSIGTKVTRAEILQTLYNRGYVVENRIIVTDLGFDVINILNEYCPRVIALQFTREIEEKMLAIRNNLLTREEVIDEVVDILKPQLMRIKQNEKKRVEPQSVIDSVPKNLPALMRAYQIGERTARSGFSRQDCKSLLNELTSEFNQLKQAIENDDPDRLLNDFGSYIFSLVNLARLLKIHPETALSGAIKAFEKRFIEMTEKD
ncbi:MAG: hypothetical protein JRF29_14090, partial [Deltaproteobacteria bacterium]|nr:hypothetical protein [Deltaproteobacteria bacterium]